MLACAGCGSDGAGIETERYELDSSAVGSALPQILVRPEGGSRPLLVLLHGRSGSPEDFLVTELLDVLDELGPRAPAVLLPTGGESSYWHDRRDGKWGTYVLREAIPEAVRRGRLDGGRLAVGGFSMGGFGALDLARVAPGRFCAVGGHSAALWLSGRETPAGAFDDAEDFARHDVLGRADLGSARPWLDVGADDPFRAANEQLAHRLGIRLRVWPGGHDHAYLRSHLADYVRFYADALAGCKRR